MTIDRVSTSGDGTQSNGDSFVSALSADGNLVAFQSTGTGLVENDTNGSADIFVKNIATGAVTRASTAADGTQSNGVSVLPAISSDGQYVAFSSRASNLVAGDTNGVGDVFVKNVATGAIIRASTAADGTQANAASEDTSQSNAAPSLSADGSRVAFFSSASNLVGGDTNNVDDVFVKDLTTGAITRASTAADGTQGNGFSQNASLSADGTRVAFYSRASNLVAGDTNSANDVFVKNLATGTISRASTAADGTQGNGNSAFSSLSADGNRVAFVSSASNLVADDTNGVEDAFVKDLTTGAITRVSTATDGTQANGNTLDVRISADGTRVAFFSSATNLVPGDTNGRTDAFVKDLRSGAITRISTAADGTQGDSNSFSESLSANGTRASFFSTSTNLVPGDTNGRADVFVVDVPVCFVTGTRIRTTLGEVAVEDLRPGDLAVTANGTLRPIRWIGHRDIVCAAYPDPRDAWPVRVKAGAIGANVPARDLLVSPDHCLLFDDVLVPAKHILNGATIVQEPVEAVTYWHVELDAHVALVAEGAAAESYRDCGMHAFFDGAEGRGTRVAPAAPMALLAPHALTGARLHAVKAWLIARARHLGARRVEDPGLELVADGRVLTPVAVENRRFRFDLPARAQEVVLRSRASVPAHWIADNEDHRRLGVRVSNLVVDGAAVAMTDERLSAGWNGAEPNGAERWTDGAARLPACTSVSFAADWFLGYPVETAPASAEAAPAREAAPVLRRVANG